MINNMNLILVTDESMILQEDNELPLSLAVGIICSYLEDHGIRVIVNDTNKIAANHTYSPEELSIIRRAFFKDRIINYISKGNDSKLDELAKMFLGDNFMHYDSYGISLGADFSMLQIHLGIILAAYLKRTTNKPIFIGGNNISYLYIFKDFYRELLEPLVKAFPFVIKGPGEQIIWEIIEGINNGENMHYFERMDGLLRIRDRDIFANKERSPQVIRPCWDSLDIKDYSYPFFNSERENEEVYYKFPLALSTLAVSFNKAKLKDRKLFIPYIFNYNCVYNCAFCTQSDNERSELIVGEVKKVVDDIEFLSKKYNSKYFYFLNNYFPSSLTYIKAFRDELKKRNLEIYWSDCGRVNGLTLEKLKILRECGCRKLVFGFETGSEKILKLIDKRLNIKELINVLNWCKEAKIWADLEVIIGLPYEREEEFMSTYSFLRDYNKLVNNFWLNEFFVVPNSLIGKYPERYGIKLTKDRITYEKNMQYNLKGFDEGNMMNLTSNARLWGFDEIHENDYRSHDTMKVENANKIKRLSTLINCEFNQLYDFYSKLIKLRKKR